MNQFVKKLIFGIAVVFAILTGLHFGTAQAATSGDYTLKPTTSDDSKVNVDGGFYLINGEPGETVDVKVEIYNTDKSDRKFLAMINTAYTNDEGNPGYDSTQVSDPNLKIQMKKITENNHQIVPVAGDESTTVTFKVKVPS